MRDVIFFIISVIVVIFCIFILHGVANAQWDEFTDFGPTHASQMFTDTTKFNGPPDHILGASDVTVQTALQSLSEHASSGVTAITECETSDDYCFTYSSGQLALYVGGTLQSKWPSVAAGVDYLLLEDGSSYVLLEDGGKIILE